MTRKVLICGGRDYNTLLPLCRALKLHTNNTDHFILGGAGGADALAEVYAILKDIKYTVYPADWNKYGKAAGPIRNKQMLDEGRPDLVVAFKGGKGTANMIKQAEEAGVPVIKND